MAPSRRNLPLIRPLATLGAPEPLVSSASQPTPQGEKDATRALSLCRLLPLWEKVGEARMRGRMCWTRPGLNLSYPCDFDPRHWFARSFTAARVAVSEIRFSLVAGVLALLIHSSMARFTERGNASKCAAASA